MNIGETIRKNRKALGMTQEYMANQLGVSAPAVNKWENGISYPDISILAPLARLLKIDVNELLAFEEELTDQEIGIFIRRLSENMMSDGIEKSFQETMDYIRQYPNSDKLILWCAQILNGYLVMKLQDLTDTKKYEDQIVKWFEKVAFCQDAELAKSAQMSLAQSYMRDQKYEEAQKLLDKIPPVGFDKRITQVQLYSEQGDFEAALKYANRISKVASLFELGDYAGTSSYFMIYVEMGNKELAMDAMEQMMNGYDTIREPKNSELYQHMKFNEDDGLEKMKSLLLKSFDSDPRLDFLREEPRYQQLCSKLE